MKALDLIGEKFGLLTVIKRCGSSKDNHSMWLCKCDCGNEKIICSHSLRRGLTKSCGCLTSNGRKVKHGNCRRKKFSGTYQSWKDMKGRCNNPKHRNYKNYGGRGVSICKEWMDKENGFINFLADMGERPMGYELDRANNNKLKNGYSPTNCRWVTHKINNENKRTNIVIEHNNKKYCLKELADEYKISPSTLKYRLSHGLSVEEALMAPDRRYKNAR